MDVKITNQFLVFLILLAVNACTFKNARTVNRQDGAKSGAEDFAGADAEGFAGAEGEGFTGIIKPIFSHIVVSSFGELKKGSVVTVVGTGIAAGANVFISNVSCAVIKVFEKSAVTCALSDVVSEITSVSLKNPDVEATLDTTPKIVLDPDKDGIANEFDNCPKVYNPSQEDSDFNGIGDECQDTDGDGLFDYEDNCPLSVNPGQELTGVPRDGSTWVTFPTACPPDGDTDEDGIPDMYDNCVKVQNPGQEDMYNSGTGDACDVIE